MTSHHIFIDNSNIYGGAQAVALEREKVPTWKCVRLNYQNLFRLIRYQRTNIRTVMLAGSVPPGNEALWDAAREAGCDTTLLRKIRWPDGGGFQEQGVDEVIHLRIGNVILDADVPGTIVIGTGDGAQTNQGCSFTDQVVRAAKHGWQVEIWSWKAQLSARLRDTRIRFPGKVTILKLDDWYPSLTFIKGGTYDVGGKSVVIVARSAAGLNLTEDRFTSAALGPVIESPTEPS
jgi:hypothetical protein